MSEYTDLLARARERFPAPDISLENVRDRRDRRVRQQRITAAALALALVVAGVGAVVSISRSDDARTPGSGGHVVQLPTEPVGPCFAEDPCWDMDVFIMRADGTQVTRLGYQEARDQAYSWSPDGQRIAFYLAEGVDDGGRFAAIVDIYTMAPDGTDVRQLTDNPAGDLFPVFSPDGTKIAFTSDRAGTWDIYVMDADGSNVVRLTEFENDSLDDYHPTWSPDGDRIAFVRGKIPPGASGKLWVIDADGSNGHVLLDAPLVYFPTWAPDGTRIAFDTGDWPDVRVGMLELASGTVTDVVAGHLPVWSPDSTRLLVTMTEGLGGFGIVDLEAPTRLEVLRSTGWAAGWSPDGEQILFNDAGLTASNG